MLDLLSDSWTTLRDWVEFVLALAAFVLVIMCYLKVRALEQRFERGDHVHDEALAHGEAIDINRTYGESMDPGDTYD